MSYIEKYESPLNTNPGAASYLRFREKYSLSSRAPIKCHRDNAKAPPSVKICLELSWEREFFLPVALRDNLACHQCGMIKVELK